MKIKTIIAAALTGAALTVSSSMTANDLMTPEILWSMHRLGSFAVSPQGDRVVYTLSTPDIQANKNRTAILTIGIDGTRRKRLTTGQESEVEPTFIADGKRIAFLKGGDLWTMDCEGQDRKQLSKTGDI